MHIWQTCNVLPYKESTIEVEVWKPIEKLQLEDRYFEVSDQGRIRVYFHNPAQALEGRVSKKNKLIHLWEVFQVYSGGAYRITVSYGKTYSVHHLVAEAFLPNPNNCKHLIHLDGNKYNNAVTNLQWKRAGKTKPIFQHETPIPDNMLEGF